MASAAVVISPLLHKFRSFCACAEYHPGLCSPFLHLVVSDDSVSGPDCTDALAMGLHCPPMPKDTFLHGVILEESSFHFRYVWLYLDIPRENG